MTNIADLADATAKKANFKTPLCRLSFPQLAEPKQMVNKQGKAEGKLQYSVNCLFAPGEDLSELIDAARAAVVEKWGEKAATDLKAGRIKSPFKQQGEKSYEGYQEGGVYISAKSDFKPFVCDKNMDPVADPAADAYPGRWAHVAVNTYTYQHPLSGRGVGFGLIGVQVLKHDSKFGSGSIKPADVFETVDLPDDDDIPGFGDANPAAIGRSIFG